MNSKYKFRPNEDGDRNSAMDEIDNDTLLECLSDAGVFDTYESDGNLVFTDNCDQVWSLTLTPQQLRELAKEFEEKADSLDGISK